ncbi:hypothetical protein GN956_G15785 [Arapaima gigas]
MPKCPKCDKEVYFAERVPILSMMENPTATVPATPHSLDPKGLAVEELKATHSSRHRKRLPSRHLMI